MTVTDQLTASAVLLKMATADRGSSSHPTASSFLPAALAGGATAGVWKGTSDLRSLRSKMEGWDSSLEPYRQNELAVKGRAVGDSHFVQPSTASQIIDKYIQGGQDVARSKVLGIPAGLFSREFARRGIDPIEKEHAVRHYNLFTRADAPQLRSHMLEKALSYRDRVAYEDPAVFTPEIRAVMERGLPVNQTLKLLDHRHPGSKAVEILRNAITGVPGSDKVRDIGEGLRLAGNGSTVMSTPRLYLNNTRPVFEAAERLRSPALLAGGLLAGGLATLPFIRHGLQKQSSTQHPDRDLVAGSALAGTGLALAPGSLNSLINPNRRVGVTYGEMTGRYGVGDIGAGHKSPGLAIEQLLKQRIAQDPRYVDFTTTRIPRNRAGLVHPNRAGLYNTIVDTGLGNSSPGSFDGAMHAQGHANPTGVSSFTHMPVLTDMVAGDRSHRMGPAVAGRGDRNAKMLGYGETFAPAAERAGILRHETLSSGLTPAVDQDALDILQSPLDREQLLNSLGTQFKDDPRITGAIAAVRKGKRLVTISGSGRGDYVASRARDLAQALKRHGIDDVTIAAQMAGAHSDPVMKDLLRDHPEIAMLPKMNRKDFVNLQRASDIHWGSSGTSSLAESLMQKTPLALPSDWGYREWYRNGGGRSINEGTPADALAKMMSEKGVTPYHGQVPVAIWNRGNVQYAHKQPGVAAINTGEDLAQLLKNPTAFQALKEQAGPRAEAELAKVLAGRTNLARSVLNEAVANVKRQRTMGGFGLAAALAAGAGGATMLHRGLQQPHPDSLLQRLQERVQNWRR